MTISISSREAQRGVSLLVVLILLLIMTVLGLAVLRSTLMQERMSGNLLDRNLNLQAAEAALREGEALAAAQTVVPAAGSGCVNGVCETPNPAVVARWLDAGFNGWRNATTNFGGTMASPPQFFIEFLGTSESWLECNLDSKYQAKEICVRPMYRVVARSQADGRASVTLQSTFVAP
ncbi:MAG: pilus assembly protein [Xanthomonadaceae bacterium]|nr:pilus assembly protein [Xanthomonadaceae bacterium]